MSNIRVMEKAPHQDEMNHLLEDYREMSENVLKESSHKEALDIEKDKSCLIRSRCNMKNCLGCRALK